MKSGYLGCYAEWNIVISNYTAIEALMSAAGGTPLMDSSASEDWAKYGQYWASTQCADDSSDLAYYAYFDASYLAQDYKDSTNYAARSFTQF